MRSPWGCTVLWAAGAGRGPGLTVIVTEGSHVPGSVWPAAPVVYWGVDDGALGGGDVNDGLNGVVLGGRLRGGGGAWVVVGGVSRFGLGFGLWRCLLGWRRCVCGVVGCLGLCWWWCCCCRCARLGAGLGLGSGLGLRSVSNLRRTSVRRCEGAGAGWEVFTVCCRGA